MLLRRAEWKKGEEREEELVASHEGETRGENLCARRGRVGKHSFMRIINTNRRMEWWGGERVVEREERSKKVSVLKPCGIRPPW